MTGPSKRVVVIGAGLAGLAAAAELAGAGHDVVVLEARTRPGGRVYTLREPFADGLHAEAGALFIPDNHDITLRYVRRFGLELVPVEARGAVELYRVGGERVLLTRGARTSWPLDLTPDEHRLGQFGMWQKYVGGALKEIGDAAAPIWPAPSLLGRYDALTGAEFLRAQGASPAAVQLLRLGYFDLLGDGLDSYSSLMLLRDLALRPKPCVRSVSISTVKMAAS